MMMMKILAQLLGNEDAEVAVETEECEEEEEGDWIIINIPGNRCSSRKEAEPLENLLIEHPSMSVYHMIYQRTNQEEEAEPIAQSLPVSRHVSWRLAGWAEPLPVTQPGQSSRAQSERRKLSRSFIHRLNLTNARLTPPTRRHGNFKQPPQRLYNY